MEILVFYITHASEELAESLVRELLDKRYIACGNIFPMQSDFLWEGTTHHEDEWVSIVKTRSENEFGVEAFINKNHPYESPCIMRWNARVNESYYNWIIESTLSVPVRQQE
jgi:periplasmic divalent cation tolerance protein